ncbi:T6SS immunity protein Tdi1 domain-containing protein [Aliikangiella sp. IMCC44359]|uniref:T6SS immunity protein Tdi1 domain-containing protein n=1 Tax=Aliikangiella sp. IMCC44359 TaxID=3459125 RepID=UPI00403B30AC
MFNSFLNKYAVEKTLEIADEIKIPERMKTIEGASDFLTEYPGASFGDGLYRIIPFDEVYKWNKLVVGIFSQFSGNIDCFAIDWLGRVFAWDYNKKKVLSLDPGFGEAMVIPCTFVDLHDIEFVEYSDESLSSGFYDECIARQDVRVTTSKCFGYKISPFLGGEDSVDNIELVDLEVYWSTSTDIYNSIQNNK